MKLSIKAKERVTHIYHAIIHHPFNQELMKGTLDKNKFAYYVEQDGLYLQDFARCLALIASKISLEYTRIFLKYADYTFVAEQEVVHQFFRDLFGFQETGRITPATLSYTSYLWRISSMEPVEVAIAAILPCFWIYREVGLFISQHTPENNPYARWIEAYSSEEFGESVEEAIHIFDTLAANASHTAQEKMLDAFYKSTVLEWHFWNDAYKESIFDSVTCI